ncbi:MAG: hypothetical protein ABEJ30_02095 [Halorientalis sp.]
MTTTVPFSLIEESVYHIEQSFTPWNMQGEFQSSVTIDMDRLEAAAETVANTFPMARARRRHNSLADFNYVWEIPDAVDPADVTVREVDGDEVPLEEAQNWLYNRLFDLTEEVPFRVMVVRGEGLDGGDRLMLSVNHVAADGVGLLRIAQALCEAYKGREPAGSAKSFEESRELLSDLRADSLPDRLDQLFSASQRLGDLFSSPTRIAEDGATDQDGWGFARRRLSTDLTDRLVADRPPGVSVNDKLLAGLHLAIAAWNEDHGERARKISTMMPVNLRPDEWFYDVVAMYSMFESVETRSRHRRDAETTVETIAEQTTEITERDREAALLEALRMLPPGTPVGLKQLLPELLRGPGQRFLDTAMLTNLGRLPMVPSLAEDAEEEIWFSPPTWKGTPVGVGVATYEGQVNFSFRYRRDLFDGPAAEEFADYFVEHVERTV